MPSNHLNPGRRAVCLTLALLALPGAALAQRVDHKRVEADFDAILQQQNRPPPPPPNISARLLGDSSARAAVELPLARFSSLWEAAAASVRQPRGVQGPAVLLAESSYYGRAVGGTLLLKLKLKVFLSRPGRYKVVPLVGQRVVLARASVGGKPVRVTSMRGYQVWITRRTGAVTLDLELVVPPLGPRGSIEYDFVVARTPVTSFSCTFPMAGLEPRLDSAVTTEARSAGKSTLFTASLMPTTRIHMQGFRDLGAARAQPQRARIFAEGLNLLSVEEGALELFSVLRYTILYAGARSFSVLIPAGVEVVSADGRGAFRYTLEPHARGELLRGQTAFPIRDGYEISLRLRRKLAAKGQSFAVPLPRCVGVARQTGWLAVEVPGRLRLAEQSRRRMLAVDVRHLPAELVRSAVSPILRAYRYHLAGRELRLSARPLPGHRTATERIDRVRAFSVVSASGGVLTEYRMELRNRLRRSLRLRVPAGARVRSVLLGGGPVKPSRGQDGALVVPLKRSAGRLVLRPITVQVLLEHNVGTLDWLGSPDLALPRAPLPIAALAWSVFLPERNRYSELRGPVATQRYAGSVDWRRPASDSAAGPIDQDAPAAGVVESASAGDMPVRIKLPRTGVRMEHARYWIPQGRDVAVSFSYLSRRLLYPLLFLLGALVCCAVVLAAAVPPAARARRWRRNGALALAALLAWPLAQLGGSTPLLLALALALVISARLGGWGARSWTCLQRWITTLPQRFRRRTGRPRPAATRLRAVGRVALTGAVVLAALLLLRGLVSLAALLAHPL